MSETLGKACPVCSGNSIHTRSLRKSYILDNLEQYFGEKPPEQLEILDYEMFQCKNCSLEYAQPLQAGSQSFYQWVTTRAGYYPKSRWEWLAVLEQIEKRKRLNRISILEIGCGKGDFMEMSKKIRDISVVGLDTTLESVKQCREKGLEAYCETIEDFQNNSISSEKFDYVISFHCLEHVSDPKSFIESMLFVLKDRGSIFISTPYSPMAFEQDWFDIMNHPPHHVTRWNKKSYNELARQLKCNVKYFMPAALSTWGRAATTFNLSTFGRSRSASKSRLLQIVATKPVLFLRILAHQFCRPKLDGRIVADVVLVELKRLESE